MFDYVSVVIRFPQPGISMCEFCLSSQTVWLWPCLGKVSYHSHTDFVVNRKVCPSMSLQLQASNSTYICSVCVFAGSSWNSRHRWSPWPTRTPREPRSSWGPWNLPVVSQCRRCKSLLCSASTLVLIAMQSNAVGTCPLHLPRCFASAGIHPIYPSGKQSWVIGGILLLFWGFVYKISLECN